MIWSRNAPRLLLAIISFPLIALGLSPRRNPERDQKRAQSLSAFNQIVLVLESPRCVNCHTNLDAPLQGDDGLLHDMNVKRGIDGRGTPAMRCTNCHQLSNSDIDHGPPGVSDWRLPPASERMAWKGVSVGNVCRGLKDPSQNRNRNLNDLLQHVTNDPIVLWGWAPGSGRTPPPLSHADFVLQFRLWIETSAACPD